MAKKSTKKSPLAKALKRPKCNAPHLIVTARAGTGKTTTLIAALEILKTGVRPIIPSSQQQAIWDAICLPEPEPRTVCFVAFNKSIATELQKRIPEGCEAMTMHSMGFRAIRNAFTRVNVNNDRVQDIVAELFGQDIRELRRTKFEVIRATEKLVSLCKMNLTLDCITNNGVWFEEALSSLATHYDIDLNGNQSEVFTLVPKVLERCKDVDKDSCVDFSDMIWLPVVLNLVVTRYDLLLVDEAQDLNRCQQELALKAGERLILCGDEKQAIYGWAGADSQSMDRMEERLMGNTYVDHPTPHCHNWDCIGVDGDTDEYCTECGLVKLKHLDRGCQVLPLTVTRRCGRAIVKEAQKIVPDFEAHERCCDGVISIASYEDESQSLNGAVYRTRVQDGDMVLCRVNAPLVSECFKFLKEGRRANIQGRDIGQGLISTIKKLMKNSTETRVLSDVELLSHRLSCWLQQETLKEQAKRNPNDARLIALQDRHDCILCFTKGQDTVEGVIRKIESIFTDDKNGSGIKLSSVHRAKGLEASRVFILQPEGAEMPHPLAKSAWQREEEMNILYVAITRAKEELIYVS